MHGLAAYSYMKKRKEWTFNQWREWECDKFTYAATIAAFRPKHDHKCDAVWIDSKGRVR